MAVIRALDENGDFAFGQNKSNYIKDEYALKQNIQTRLLEWKNDCFFDKDAGIDYDYFLTSKQTKTEFENAIRLVILQTEDVRSIERFLVQVESRSMKIFATISSIYGTFNENI